MNPWKVLGVTRDAGDEEIRAAYLERVESFPPERAPEEFERIRDAYDALRDPRRRLLVWLDASPEASFVDLLDEVKPQRRFVGPDPWLAVMEETS